MDPRRFQSIAVLAAVSLLAGAGAPAADTLLDALPAHWLDDRGHDVDLHALRDRRLVFTMAYATCHRVCPMTVQRLRALQDELDAAGERATFVVVGYDPERDDPSTWRAWRREHHLERPDWLLLSGADGAEVHQFADALGFSFWSYDEHVMHDERVVVIAPGGHLQLAAGPGAELHAIDLEKGI